MRQQCFDEPWRHRYLIQLGARPSHSSPQSPRHPPKASSSSRTRSRSNAPASRTAREQENRPRAAQRPSAWWPRCPACDTARCSPTGPKLSASTCASACEVGPTHELVRAVRSLHRPRSRQGGVAHSARVTWRSTPTQQHRKLSHNLKPHPCGYAGDSKRICRCSLEQAQRYRSRISGPLIDRFDMHVQLSSVPITALRNATLGESSAIVRERVVAARERARERAQRQRSKFVTMDVPLSTLAPDARQLLFSCVEKLGLSMRAYSKVLRVSRTIADLEGVEMVQGCHIAEAVQFRLFDREVDDTLSPP